jgi:hypothetical protein
MTLAHKKAPQGALFIYQIPHGETDRTRLIGVRHLYTCPLSK